MSTKLKFAILLGLANFAFSAYSAEQKVDDRTQGEIVTVTIVGSAESPDPVLVRVRELEQKGVLTNVVVMESFPVQIRVTGARGVIHELQSIPRKKILGLSNRT